jgi:hypothetical protein
MVACSALITPQIEQKTIQVGFDMACESPLRKQTLNDYILPKVFSYIQKERIILNNDVN